MAKLSKINLAAPGLVSFLCQLLETEMGGVQVYRTALQCAQHPELIKEWSKYLAQTERHVVVARGLLQQLGIDPDVELPARIVNLMLEALAAGTPDDAELTAVECVVTAETKDHMNWELVGKLAEQADGAIGEALSAAYSAIEIEEDRHYYHNLGWARELWAKALGVPATLPPIEERRDVTSQAEAAEAKEAEA